jgi:hypothetical protein
MTQCWALEQAGALKTSNPVGAFAWRQLRPPSMVDQIAAVGPSPTAATATQFEAAEQAIWLTNPALVIAADGAQVAPLLVLTTTAPLPVELVPPT